tara:strand:+ start:295 stop:486 length:192 start_codon:yes stop_codon:yes gene_type:complete
MKKSIQTPLGVYTDDEPGIEMIESYVNQRVVDELELILDRTKLAVNIDSFREHIVSQIKLKQG